MHPCGVEATSRTAPRSFTRCSRCTLVGLKHVRDTGRKLFEAVFQMHPCGVEAVHIESEGASTTAFQMHPCGVEAAHALAHGLTPRVPDAPLWG